MEAPIFRSLAIALASWLPLIPAASAASVLAPSPAEALRAGGLTVPAAWAGVWSYADSTFDCTTDELLGGDASVDTLCTGANLQPGGVGALDCSGTVSDTNVNVTCMVSEEIFPGCSVEVMWSLVGVRTGNTATVTVTNSVSYSPPGCLFKPDSCTRTESTGTRVAPEPPGCGTPLDAGSWGSIKARYR